MNAGKTYSMQFYNFDFTGTGDSCICIEELSLSHRKPLELSLSRCNMQTSVSDIKADKAPKMHVGWDWTGYKIHM